MTSQTRECVSSSSLMKNRHRLTSISVPEKTLSGPPAQSMTSLFGVSQNVFGLHTLLDNYGLVDSIRNNKTRCIVS